MLHVIYSNDVIIIVCVTYIINYRTMNISSPSYSKYSFFVIWENCLIVFTWTGSKIERSLCLLAEAGKMLRIVGCGREGQRIEGARGLGRGAIKPTAQQ